jgi:hypothetical protein
VLSTIARRASTERGWLATADLHLELMSSFTAQGQPRRSLRLYAQLLRARAPASMHVYNGVLTSVCAEYGVPNAYACLALT